MSENRASMSAEEKTNEQIAEAAAEEFRVWVDHHDRWDADTVRHGRLINIITAALAAKDAEPKHSGNETQVTREPTSQETGDDTARLDWLANTPADVIFTFNTKAGAQFFVSDYHGGQARGSDLRKAIDEARSRAPDEPRPSGISVSEDLEPDEDCSQEALDAVKHIPLNKLRKQTAIVSEQMEFIHDMLDELEGVEEGLTSMEETHARLQKAIVELRHLRAREQQMREAIQHAVAWANGRESEWGDRAVTAFNFLYAVLETPALASPTR